MNINMGSVDKGTRILSAIVLMILQMSGVISGNWGLLALAVAGLFIVTSARGRCPIYAPFKFNSFGWDKKD